MVENKQTLLQIGSNTQQQHLLRTRDMTHLQGATESPSVVQTLYTAECAQLLWSANSAISHV
jgi:hypothetical protein